MSLESTYVSLPPSAEYIESLEELLQQSGAPHGSLLAASGTASLSAMQRFRELQAQKMQQRHEATTFNRTRPDRPPQNRVSIFGKFGFYRKREK